MKRFKQTWTGAQSNETGYRITLIILHHIRGIPNILQSAIVQHNVYFFTTKAMLLSYNK